MSSGSLRCSYRKKVRHNMTKKERAYIESKIDQYDRFAAEERAAAQRELDDDAMADHYEQERLNECAANVLSNLLSVLG